jgi:pimeloyl-ACP methyl ester carboxylesterase
MMRMHGDAPLTLPDLADLVADLVTALPGPADVVVNSFGCQVAVELALRHPTAARRLVLTSPVTPRRLRSLLALAARFAAAKHCEPWR